MIIYVLIGPTCNWDVSVRIPVWQSSYSQSPCTLCSRRIRFIVLHTSVADQPHSIWRERTSTQSFSIVRSAQDSLRQPTACSSSLHSLCKFSPRSIMLPPLPRYIGIQQKGTRPTQASYYRPTTVGRRPCLQSRSSKRPNFSTVSTFGYSLNSLTC